MSIRTFVAVGLACIFAAGRVLAEVGNWDGEQLVDVTISVVDNLTGGPVRNAEVWLVTGKEVLWLRIAKEYPTATSKSVESFGARAKTCLDGTLRFGSTFESGGGFKIVNGEKAYTGKWWISGHIEIRRSGYHEFIAEIADLGPDKERDINDPRLQLAIRLKRKESEKNATVVPKAP